MWQRLPGRMEKGSLRGQQPDASTNHRVFKEQQPAQTTAIKTKWWKMSNIFLKFGALGWPVQNVLLIIMSPVHFVKVKAWTCWDICHKNYFSCTHCKSGSGIFSCNRDCNHSEEYWHETFQSGFQLQIVKTNNNFCNYFILIIDHLLISLIN